MKMLKKRKYARYFYSTCVAFAEMMSYSCYMLLSKESDAKVVCLQCDQLYKKVFSYI